MPRPLVDHAPLADRLGAQAATARLPREVRSRTGYRSSEAELSAVRKLNPFGHATKPSILPAAPTPTTHRMDLTPDE
jgi:hypothetical protein